MRWLLAFAIACKASSDPAPDNGVPKLSSDEIKRSRDACADYVTHACECAKTVDGAKKQCELAKAMPEAIRLGLEVAGNPETAPKDVRDAQRQIRQAVSSCIEENAKLATLGCP